MSTQHPPFEKASNHEAVSEIIKRHSTNRADVRQVALQDLDFRSVKRVVDLGCGFGFMSEEIARRLPQDAEVLGVDAWDSNRDVFLSKVGASGRNARFIQEQLGLKLPFADRSFDMVVCSFSLYFFVETVPDIARVLRPEGVFVALTHAESALRGLLELAGLPESESHGAAFTAKPFSAENGNGILSKRFKRVKQIEYRNSLRFGPADIEALLKYLSFKLYFAFPENRDGGLPDAVITSVKDAFSRAGEIVIGKDDSAFHCWDPIWP